MQLYCLSQITNHHNKPTVSTQKTKIKNNNNNNNNKNNKKNL